MPALPLRTDFDAKSCRSATSINADSPDDLINRRAPGKPKLTADQLAAVAAMVESGQIPSDSHASDL